MPNASLGLVLSLRCRTPWMKEDEKIYGACFVRWFHPPPLRKCSIWHAQKDGAQSRRRCIAMGTKQTPKLSQRAQIQKKKRQKKKRRSWYLLYFLHKLMPSWKAFFPYRTEIQLKQVISISNNRFNFSEKRIESRNFAKYKDSPLLLQKIINTSELHSLFPNLCRQHFHL